ncbi:class I SAM-dependent methyltransferase [Salinicoccus sp. HZC-1]|uniref:class I SAM-dependent methyltransferase n=1 Tax=Salinicoccus sp. HZC-1 TaxID=3385497 RepID=UPI00398B1400
MSHYFTNDNTEHDFGQIEFQRGNKTYRFITDRGVFSRERIDFGSKVLIDAVIEDWHGSENSVFIDMGAGYGPLGIIIGDALNMKPVMVEVNEDAIDICRKNADINGIRAEVLKRDVYDAESTYSDVDLYITNPPFRAGKPVVLSIIEDAADRLSAGGAFYMVVQKKQGMPSYKKAIDASFGNVESVANEKGYHVLKGVKNY